MTKNNNETKTVAYYVIKKNGSYLAKYKQNSAQSLCFTAKYTTEIEFAAKGFPAPGQKQTFEKLAAAFEGELVAVEAILEEMPTGTTLEEKDPRQKANEDEDEEIEAMEALSDVLDSFISMLGGDK
ncbi:hypothetical protein SAMN05421767_10651 [Granulicatella balaenopterae]|uniref:Phage protein n=1 Tax=Granulicatella balaenopterae TaxID=137733 RepID=A0A1H9IPJ5_9LACT|nr:hypothetical protein [Granulicatella balaenopterae]SEQ76514.1 hypothetical protein SAMN05421767_10651 [Granulicatella balaenopterae]